MLPLKQEGYVVVDQYFNRVKVKHPGYVALHHLKEGMNLKRVVELVQQNEVEEIIIAFPEWKTEFVWAQEAFNTLQKELEKAYEKIKHIDIQKEFASEAIKTRCCHALFAFRNGKVKSIRQFLCALSAESLLELLTPKASIAQLAE